jgi:hypothetical protein
MAASEGNINKSVIYIVTSGILLRQISSLDLEEE